MLEKQRCDVGQDDCGTKDGEQTGDLFPKGKPNRQNVQTMDARCITKCISETYIFK